MREKFASDLYELMRNDKNIVLIIGDVGYGVLDKIRADFSDQCINTGAAEMTMMDIAVGFALSGKIPIVYTITPFLLFRPFEAIRNYINHEKIPVVMVGLGRGNDYNHLGFSHDASDDIILKSFENIVFLEPEEGFNLKEIVYSKKPVYLNLKR
jgi:transketolase